MDERDVVEAFSEGRHAGRTLTLDALEKGVVLRPLIDSAATVAEFADEAIGILQEEYKPPLDCRQGCWYCCCNPEILVSVPELLRILEIVEEAFSREAKRALQERARTYAESVKGRSLDELAKEKPIPCPLLIENSCSVYAARPLICRGWNSMDVNACRKDYEDAIDGIPGFEAIKRVADGALVGSSQALGSAGANDALVDLGPALDAALSYGDGVEEALVDGRPILKALENTRFVKTIYREFKTLARSVGMKID